ncbi:GNAT family N-acetyltransferase [Planctomycetota bacterium]
MDVAFLEGKGIYLRELRESDLEGNWYNWFNDAKVTTFQNKKIFPNTKQKQRKYFERLNASTEDVVFAIVESETKKHIGNVGLHHIDWVHRSAELGIVIGDISCWGRKYGQQAWRLITEYGFNTLNLHRLYAIIMTENHVSVKCAEASRFRREGKISSYFFKNGEYKDVYYYNAVNGERQDV